MRRSIFAVLPVALLSSGLAFAQNAAEKVAPTIPETQIKPAELSSPFEFLSASTSADTFVIDAAALAQTNAGSAEVKTLAQDFAASHKTLMAASQAAGKTDKVDIAAPSPDGEQKGVLSKLEALQGADFDKAFVEAVLFAYQRTLAYYRGYADEGDALAKFASENLPQIVTQYGTLLAVAEKVGIGNAAQTPAP